MQALSIAFEAIVPLFLIIAVGYGVKRLGWIGLEEVRRFNKVTFYTFMPVMLFYNIYISDFSQAVRLPYVLFVVGMALGMAVVAFGVVLLAEKAPERRGVMIQAAFRSNFVLLGLPIAAELLPGGNLGVTALMIAIVVPFYNMMSVVVLEYFRGGKPNLGEVLLAVAKNPLIIASVLGLLMQGLHIALPEVLVSFAGKMNSAATPLILLLLGASFEAQELAAYKKELLVCGSAAGGVSRLDPDAVHGAGAAGYRVCHPSGHDCRPHRRQFLQHGPAAGRRQSSGGQRRGGVHRVVLLHAVFLDHAVQAAGYVLKPYKIKENAP